MTRTEQLQVLMNYRIAYLGETMVNWCPQLGTVLANDEVVDGKELKTKWLHASLTPNDWKVTDADGKVLKVCSPSRKGDGVPLHKD